MIKTTSLIPRAHTNSASASLASNLACYARASALCLFGKFLGFGKPSLFLLLLRPLLCLALALLGPGTLQRARLALLRQLRQRPRHVRRADVEADRAQQQLELACVQLAVAAGIRSASTDMPVFDEVCSTPAVVSWVSWATE